MFRFLHWLRVVRCVVVASLGCYLFGGSHAAAIDVQDLFNRANGGLGANWKTVAGTMAPQIIGNQVGVSAGESGQLHSAYWSANTFSGNQYAQASFPNIASGCCGPGIAVRLADSRGYFLWWGNGASDVSLWRMDSSGSWSFLASSGSLTVAPTDVWRLEAVGNNLRGYQNGNLVVTAADATYSGGSPGVWLYYSGHALANWSAGDIAGYAIGGTVTGLRGSLVLQNNGGDTLTLTQNGPFKFATPLTNGAAYAVSVLSQPSGQTGTVLNGSGTVTGLDVTTVSIVCTNNPTAGPSAGAQSDNFNRADGGLGPNWRTIAGTMAPQIIGNQVDVSAGESGQLHSAYWSANTFSGNQYVQASFPSIALGCCGPGIAVRLADSRGYFLWWEDGASNVSLWRMDSSSSWSYLASSGSLTVAPTDVWRLEAAGNNLRGYQNGNLVVTAADATYSGGSPGIWLYYSGHPLANWSAGEIAGYYSIGGTVSGLSGSLKLQNNGGDTLTLTQNGPFKFATPLTNGAAYAVSVLSQPSGQTSTVLNGSGTVTGLDVTSVSIVCTNNPTAAPPAGAQSDSFNRADGGLGANWRTVAGTMAPQIIGNQVDVSAGESGQLHSAYWSANTFSGNQYVQASFPNIASGCCGPGIAVRLADSRGYFLWWEDGASNVTLWRMDSSGSWSYLASSGSLTVAPTDVWRLEAVGNNLRGYQNGNLVVTAADATYSGGSPGIWLYYSGHPLANWSAGDIAGYAIGGTVTGLSGSLKLQNNGGDTLTVTHNGAFCFTTPLTNGAAYAVTVLSEPSSQTCTVLNGSGTVTGLDVNTLSIVCTNNPAVVLAAQTDNFNRPDGALGPNWANLPEGGVAIASGHVVGTQSGSSSGSYRIDASYNNDQYSEITVTSSPLSAWIGASVRNQGNGNLYVGVYYANSGSPQLRLYKRVGGGWTQLEASYDCGTLAAGTKLRLVVVGATLAFLQNGVERIATYDADISAGAPGIMVWGTDALGNWAGGNAGFQAYYLSSDVNGIESYHMFSTYNGYGPHVLRVLRPNKPAPGVPHNVLYVLPVESEGGTTYGDGLLTLQGLNAQNQYNLTLIAPSFSIVPWYADHATDPNYQYESFMSRELQPWVKTNLAITGSEQHWLLGFSKSGFGGIDLLFKHPDQFTLGGFWDFPATGFTTFDQFGGSGAANYGTDANFQANYRLTSAFINGYRNPFLTQNRLWFSGYADFQQEVTDFDAFLTAAGVAHTFATPVLWPAHSWDSGWVPEALGGLHQNSIQLPAQ